METTSHSAAAAAIRAEERKRLSTVFDSDAVKGREQLAAMLIVETNLTSAEIIKKLPTLSGAAAPVHPMLQRLLSTSNPQLG